MGQSRGAQAQANGQTEKKTGGQVPGKQMETLPAVRWVKQQWVFRKPRQNARRGVQVPQAPTSTVRKRRKYAARGAVESRGRRPSCKVLSSDECRPAAVSRPALLLARLEQVVEY